MAKLHGVPEVCIPVCDGGSESSGFVNRRYERLRATHGELVEQLRSKTPDS
jgi:hypothetical protein